MVFAGLSMQAQYQIFKDLDAGNTASLEVYIQADNDLDAKYKNHTLLNKTIELGLLDHAKQLVEKGADVNLQSDLKAPLVFATKTGNLDFVKYLIEKGARVDRASEDDLSIADIALKAGNAEMSKFLREEIRKAVGR